MHDRQFILVKKCFQRRKARMQSKESIEIDGRNIQIISATSTARVMRLITIGVAIGAGASLWASTFVGSLLYGLEPRDPATLVFAAAVLGGVGAFAGWLPARRASRIDPAEVLRDS